MKKIYLAALSALAFCGVVNAQNACNGGRYSSDVYTSGVTSAIVYGNNTNYLGTPTSLTLDVYQGTGDTALARPLIIWVHGGSFLGGSSTDADVLSLSQHFAKKGFVCASINYRVGMNSIDSSNAILAVIRGVQDLKAAVRFFYKDKKSGANVYKIDTNNIFIGGSSAGALTVMHSVYLKRPCQIQEYISNANLAAMGGLDGLSGNQGYSMKVKGVISLCGALAKYDWMEAGDPPVCMMHGTADAVVTYNRGMVNPGIPLMYLDGSRVIFKQAQTIGVTNTFYSWYGAPHVPYAGSSASQLAYMDTTVNFVRDYLINSLGCTNAPLQPADAAVQNATLYTWNSPCNTGIESFSSVSELQQVFPNPSSSEVTLVFTNNNSSHLVQLFDLNGKVISSAKASEATFTLKKDGIAPGIYFLRVSNEHGQYSGQKLIFN